MRTHTPFPRRQEGAILAVVLVMMVVLAFLGVGLLTLSNATGYEAGSDVSALQAFWTAEAGLEQVKVIGVKRKKPFASIVQAGSPSGFLFGTNALSGSTSKGSYSVDVLNDPAWTNAVKALKKYIIVSRATSGGGEKQRVTQSAMIQSFASYMHATHWEQKSNGDNIWFATGDKLDGPVYVNDQLNILGSPRFLQLVSSAASSVNYSPANNPSVFEGGLALNAAPLDITGQFSSDHILDIKTEAASGGLTLSGNYNFKFNNDGSFTYIPRTTGTPTNTGYLSSLNGAIYVDGSVWVEGIVNGSVTLAAQDSVYISNNITYASAQSPNPWQTNTFNPDVVTDKLGLMASNRCIIMTTNSVSIHAAIMVTSGSDGFGATNRYEDLGGPQINLFGSLSQYRRGVVGRPDTPFLGFYKNYKFDTRFNTDSPPNFPYSMYTFTRWEQDGY